MKVAILAGGFGTRLAEETDVRPKPMIEIGGMPILWHIMKYYSSFGHKDFVLLLGYKSYYIKEYFANYYLHKSDVTVNVKTGRMDFHSNDSDDWNITMLETGLNTMTGGRVKRAEQYLMDDRFMLTYGDGLSNVDINELISSHTKSGCAMTMTTVQPEGRFGAVNINSSGQVSSFLEKPSGDGNWINGGFFVCEPKIFEYLNEDESLVLEQAPLMNLAKSGELNSYKHGGFWKPMDALRDKMQLEEMWKTNPKWKTW